MAKVLTILLSIAVLLGTVNFAADKDIPRIYSSNNNISSEYLKY